MIFAALVSFVILSIASSGSFWEVYIDDNTLLYHLEVFESVTRLGEHIIQDDPSKQDAQQRPIKFIFKEKWFRDMGGKMFWETYAPGGRIGKSGSTYEFRNPTQKNIHRIPSRCPPLDKFDLHIVVTLPPTFMVPDITATCLMGYENNSKIAFVVHHAEEGSNTAAILHWTNVYVASKARSVVAKTPRFFSPVGLIIPPVPPNCNAPPVFVVQGSLQDRRDIGELAHILSLPEEYKFTVKILCKKELPLVLLTDRVQHLRHLAFTPYHEKILGAAFMLPLISPTHESTANYFHGHPTSSVAYGVHYKLRFLGHVAVRDEYSLEMQADVPGYWHNGTESGIRRAVGLALRDFNKYCSANISQRGSWSG
jgi:hypothetical protein